MSNMPLPGIVRNDGPQVRSPGSESSIPTTAALALPGEPLAWPLAAAARPTIGTASGSLTVNDETVPIRHAYSRAAPHLDRIQYHILLTDLAVDAATLNDPAELRKRSRDGSLRSVLIELHADGEQRIDIRHPAFKPLSYVNVGGRAYELAISIQTPTWLEGHVFMPRPAAAFGDRWSYDIRFMTPVIHGARW